MPKVTQNSAGQWGFDCPGCGHRHDLPPKDPVTGRGWAFNRDVEKPTFAPSILLRSGHYCKAVPNPEDCGYCQEKARGENDWGMEMCVICHSFVNDGKIQFLTDSTHVLAGQTVPLGDV